MPVRRVPAPYDEAMHLGYAIQWFVFATILSVGSLVLVWSRRRRAGAEAPALPTGPRSE